MTKKCTFLYDKSPSFHDIASIPDFFEKPQIALLGSFPNDPKIWGLSVNDPKNWGLWNTRVIYFIMIYIANSFSRFIISNVVMLCCSKIDSIVREFPECERGGEYVSATFLMACYKELNYRKAFRGPILCKNHPMKADKRLRRRCVKAHYGGILL